MYIKELEIHNFTNEEGKIDWENFTAGQHTVVNSYFYKTPNTFNLLVIDTIVWDDSYTKGMQSTIDYLKELGIKQFIFADKSTACLEEIMTLIDNNCKMERVTYGTKKDFTGRDRELEGILVTIK